MVVHRLCGSRSRHGDLKDTHKFVFENYFVAVRGGFYRVIAIREASFVLSIGIKIHGDQHDEAYG
jgi:hypothetical protein